MPKPVIVFVSAAWHTPAYWESTTTILKQHGYTTIAEQLPSAGAEPPHTDFHTDVMATRDIVEKLVDEGEEVVVVSHSVSGMSACDALRGLGKAERNAQTPKQEGGVIRLVFIMSLAMPEGFDMTAGDPQWPYWMRLNDAKDRYHVLPEDAKEVFYNDLPEDEADKWASQLIHESAGIYYSVVTYAAWRYIPSTYVCGKQDKTTITPELVKYMIDSAREQVPTAFDVVEECEGGHFLMLSHPRWLADVLRRAAGEKV